MKIVAGKVYTNEKTYTGCRECKKKECTCNKHDMGEIKFNTYSTKVGDRYYTIKGWGAKNVQEGDTLEGEISSKEYNGKTYYTITLPKPDPLAEVKELKSKVEDLESRIYALEQAVFGEKNEPLPEEEPDFDMSDIPF